MKYQAVEKKPKEAPKYQPKKRRSPKNSKTQNWQTAPPKQPRMQVVHQEASDSADDIKVLTHTYASYRTALTAVKTEIRRIQRGEQKFSLTLAQGNPAICPQCQPDSPSKSSREWQS